MPHIRIENVTKTFGKSTAVENLNLEIQDGEFVSLLGPSGCGKTTTLRMIAGLETPTDGDIFIDDVCVFSARKGIDISPDKRHVGFLFQNYALWPHMTVFKNIAFGLENLKWDRERIASRVDELLKMLKIEEFVDRYPSELSGGQQQRVAIARTLSTGPKVLFMDEPLSNLDAKLRMEMRTELKRLHLETGATFVYVTHDQLEAMTLSTQICLLERGVLQQYEPPLRVYKKPTNLFVADFVGSPNINTIQMSMKKVNVDEILLQHPSIQLMFNPSSSNLTPVDGSEVILGIRPEDIVITDSGIPAEIYSTLPSGMETIIKLKVDSLVLTSVVFGDVDYPVGEKVHITFKGKDFILFDGENHKNIAVGSLS